MREEEQAAEHTPPLQREVRSFIPSEAVVQRGFLERVGENPLLGKHGLTQIGREMSHSYPLSPSLQMKEREEERGNSL